MMRHACLVAAAALLIVVAPAQANLLMDGGFEVGLAPVPDTHLTVFPGEPLGAWTVIGRPLPVIGVPRAAGSIPVLQGREALHIGESALMGGVTQSFPTEVGEGYELIFGAIGWSGLGALIHVEVGDLATDVVVPPVPAGADNAWATHSLTFTATDTTSTLLLQNVPPPTCEVPNCASTIDDVRVIVDEEVFEFKWGFDGSGNWFNGSNWGPKPQAPNGNDKEAIFDSVITADATVSISEAVTIKSVKFDNLNTYTIAGPGGIIFEANEDNAGITVEQGDHLVTTDATFNSDTNVAINGGSLTFRGNVTLNGVNVSSGAASELAAFFSLSGNGTFDDRVNAETLSTIRAKGGNLTLGDANSLNGFSSNGTMLADDNIITLNDANDASLESGTLVDLGPSGTGELAAPNGLTLHFSANITGSGTISTPNDATKPFTNNGNVVGSGDGITTTGYVMGVGTFDNVTHEGTYSPGFSPAVVNAGSVTYAGTLLMELAGTAQGDFDQINHILGSGVATLGGTLDVDLVSGFSPQDGDTFDIMTAIGGVNGTFNTTFPAGNWNIIYGANTVTLEFGMVDLMADFDKDGDVDGDDFLIWQGGFGTTSGAMQADGDSDGDGDVDGHDFLTWQSEFGSGTGGGSSGAVPEPSSALLLILALSGAVLASTKARRGRRYALLMVPVMGAALLSVSTPAARANLLLDGGFEVGLAPVPDAFHYLQSGEFIGAWEIIGSPPSGIPVLGAPYFIGEFPQFEGLEIVFIGDSRSDGGVTQSFTTEIGLEYLLNFAGIGWAGSPATIHVEVGDLVTDVDTGQNGAEWTSHFLTFKATGTTSTLVLQNVAGASQSAIDAVSVEVAPLIEPTWNVDGSGNWLPNGNWGPIPITPNGNDQEATLGDVITADATISTNEPVTVRSLRFNNANSYTIDGPGGITFEANTGGASITVPIPHDQGDHFVTADATFNSNTDITLNGSSLTFRGNISVNGVSVSSGAASQLASYVTLSGSGAFNSRVNAAAFSTIQAVGGNLAVGDANALNGFTSGGTIRADNHTITLNDANDAALESSALVDLGSSGTGELAAPNGLTLDFSANIIGAGTINTPNDPAKPFISNGNVVGSGSGITTTGYVKGVGSFDNVTHSGTYSPGFSPAVVDSGSVTYAGTLLIELGGTSDGDFDQIHHVLGNGVASLEGTLDLDLISGFAPEEGDTFDIITAAGGVQGTFDTLDFPGDGWDISYGDNVVTLAFLHAAVPEPSSAAILIFVLGGAALARKSRRGPHHRDEVKRDKIKRLTLLTGVLTVIATCVVPSATAQEVFWCGFGCSSSDWGNGNNWEGFLPADPDRAVIDGAFDGTFAAGPGVDAVTATIGSIYVLGGSKLNIGNGVTLTTTASSAFSPGSLLGSAFGDLFGTGDGTVNLSGNGTWVNEDNNIFLGDSENGAGTINMTDSSVLNAAGGINTAYRSNGTVNLSGTASLTAETMALGFNGGDLGVNPDMVLTLAGDAALNVTSSLIAGRQANSVNVTMSGGTLEVGDFVWNAPAGTFDFTGGSIIVNANRRDIITQAWFNFSAASASFDGTQTRIDGITGADISFGSEITGDSDVAIAADSPIDSITLDTPHSITIDAIDVAAGPTTINVLQGDHIIISDVTQSETTNVNVTGGSLQIRGNFHVDNGTFGPGALLALTASKVLSGSGAFNSSVTAAKFSTVSADGGDLAVGDANAVNGFYSNGTVLANNNTLTLNDANDAGLDSGVFVDLGSAGTGELAAPNGLTLDFAGNITGAGTINTPNDPATPFINHGNVVGTGGGITTTGYVKGVGIFDNVTHAGTYSPGLSPAVVEVGSTTYAGVLEIELGGHDDGQFDQIQHTIGDARATLGGTLDVALIDGFVPMLGDTFDIISAETVIGAFDEINLPSLDGLAFNVLYGSSGVRLTVAVPEPASLLLGICGFLFFYSTRRRQSGET